MLNIKVKKKLHSSQGEMLLDVNLSILRGDFISISGKSGAGKTTLLKILAGLITPDEGDISVDEAQWFSSKKGINVKPQKRNIGFVFQDYALFPNMTVKENLKFVASEKKDFREIEEILEITGLTELESRHPSTLSGGQQQRVALARALVRKPDLLLLDEPLSALDHQMRLALQNEIAKIHRHFGLTTLMISHDPSEIFRLSDKVIELDFGKIVNQGTPEDVFQHNEISGKFQVVGDVLSVNKNDIVYIVKVFAGNKIVKVVVTEDQVSDIKPGDKVLVSSKAFNPVLMKLV